MSQREALEAMERELKEARSEVSRLQGDAEKLRKERMQAVSEVRMHPEHSGGY